MLPAADWLALPEADAAQRVPYLLAVDADDALQRVVVDSRLMQAARRCLLLWRCLQEHGGVNDSHAQALLLREKAAWAAQQKADAPGTVSVPAAGADGKAAVTAGAEANVQAGAVIDATAAPAVTQHSRDEAWIETARCPTRFVWLLNLNQEFPSVDVSFGPTTVSTALPCPGLTLRLQVEYGTYTVALRDRFSGIVENFDGVRIDSQSPSIFVFYRRFASTLLVSLAPEIINYFDSNVPLDVDLFEGGNNVQVETLPFEGSALQNSRSVNCQLRLYATASPVLVYDSGLQQRTDSIVVNPRFPAAELRSGEVAVVGLNFDGGFAAMVSWPNVLG